MSRDSLQFAANEFRIALHELGLDPETTTIVVSKQDGLRLEHMLSGLSTMVVDDHRDDRASKPKADHHIREFEICGLRFQYRTEPFMLRSGKVV